MRMLKFAGTSIVILFVVASLIGLLLPAHVLVSRATNIEQYRDSIMPYVKDIGQWKLWMEGMDDSSVTVYSSSHAKLGNSTVRIIQQTDSTVVSSWTARNGNTQTATILLIGDRSKKITVAQWQFEQKLKWYPWERLGSIMNDKILGTMMEKNLGKLKSLNEQNPD